MCSHRRRVADATKQFRRVGVGGVYWALGCFVNFITNETRMVQLPATAVIEYVAAVNACLIYIISSV